MHHDLLLTKWKFPLTVRSQFELEPKPQSGGPALPILGLWIAQPTLCQRDAPMTRLTWIHKQDIQAGDCDKSSIMTSFTTQYMNFQRSFSLHMTTGFCTGQTKPQSSSYHMQMAKLKQMHFYKEEFSFQITSILCCQSPWWKVLGHV